MTLPTPEPTATTRAPARPRRRGRIGAGHIPAIAGRIQVARKLRQMSLVELGDAVGSSYQQMQNYESGRHSPTAGCLLEIARALRLAVTFFYDDCPSGPVADLPPPDCARIATDCAALPEPLRRQVAALVADLAAACPGEAGHTLPIAAE